jgi:hypothetical protein
LADCFGFGGILGLEIGLDSKEIPIGHIWNGRNHLLHCSFVVERFSPAYGKFACKVVAYQQNGSSDNSVEMDVEYDFVGSNVNPDRCEWIKYQGSPQ